MCVCVIQPTLFLTVLVVLGSALSYIDICLGANARQALVAPVTNYRGSRDAPDPSLTALDTKFDFVEHIH